MRRARGRTGARDVCQFKGAGRAESSSVTRADCIYPKGTTGGSIHCQVPGRYALINTSPTRKRGTQPFPRLRVGLVWENHGRGFPRWLPGKKPKVLLNQAQVRAYHSMGHKVMSYANPQGGREMPEKYRRNYGLELWRRGLDGACTYAYQHSLGHGWDDFDGGPGWPLRDHNMAYPTVSGVIPTLQWEGYREGYDDLRYMATLENLIEEYKRQDSPPGEAARAAQMWLMALDPSDPRLDPSELDQILDETRARIIEQIQTLRQTIPLTDSGLVQDRGASR